MYDRVLEITNCIAEYICIDYEEKNVVCPTNLLKNVFTTAAGDNIDHNPTSTTVKSWFHGTGISLFQHPTLGSKFIKTVATFPSKASSKKVAKLPVFYTDVKPMLRTYMKIPRIVGPYTSKLV